MERFGPALRRISGELDVAGPVRTELLLEMAADLEAVYAHHRARGVAEDEATRLAERTVLGSSEVIRRLGRLHEGPLRGWRRPWRGAPSGRLDLFLLAVGVLPILLVAAGVSAWGLAADTSLLAGLVVLVGLWMTARVAAQAVRLLRDRPVRSGQLPSLLVLAAMAPGLGILAPVLGLQRAAAGVVGGPAGPTWYAASLARDGATLLAGLLLGIGGLLGWFILREREALRRAREVDALLEGGDGAGPPRPSAAASHHVIPLVRRRHG